jgi:hypothetical protein
MTGRAPAISGTTPSPGYRGSSTVGKIAEQGPLRDHRGRLRPPAYVLIALVIALVAILLLLVGVLFAPD